VVSILASGTQIRGFKPVTVRRHAPAASTPGKDPVPIVQEAVWATGPVWKGAENLAPTGNRYPDRPALSQSLYRLSYLAHQNPELTDLKCHI
jgi:hypothetical protein